MRSIGFVFVVCLAFAVVGVGVCALSQPPPQVEYENGVAVLNDDSFDAFTQPLSSCVVVFHAPWCTHCRDWMPEFEAVSQELAPLGIVFGKVDVASDGRAKSTATAQRLGVTTFPTMKLFHFGRENTQARLPRGREALQDFLWQNVRRSSEPLRSVAEVKGTVAKYKYRATLVIGFYADHSKMLRFIDIGQGFRHMMLFFHVADANDAPDETEAKAAVLSYFNLSDTFVVFRHHADAQTEALQFSGQEPGAPSRAGLDAMNPDYTIFSDYVLRDPSGLDKPRFGYLPFGSEIGGAAFNREAVTKWIAQFGFSPIGVLTEKNRELYNERSTAKLFMFLPFNADATVSATASSDGESAVATATTYSGEGTTSGNEKRPPSSARKRQRPVSDQKQCTTVMHPEQGMVRTCTSPKTATVVSERIVPPPSEAPKGATEASAETIGDQEEAMRRLAATRRNAALPPEIRYYSTRFRRLARSQRFQNFSFLFLNPTDGLQIFDSFGFTWRDLYTDSADSDEPGRQRTLATAAAMAAAFPFGGTHRNNVMGAIVGRRKYRYPYDYFDSKLVERFLSDALAGTARPFIKSGDVPTSIPPRGSGLLVPLVLDNFEALVKRDRSTDSLVLFCNPYESHSLRAVRAVEEFARVETGNEHLLIGTYNALHNDPPRFFEFAHLPLLFYVPKSTKANLRFGTDAPLNTAERTARWLMRRKKRASVMRANDAVAEGNDDEDEDDYETETDDRFRPVEYGGDFSPTSLAAFAEQNREVPVRNTLVEHGRGEWPAPARGSPSTRDGGTRHRMRRDTR